MKKEKTIEHPKDDILYTIVIEVREGSIKTEINHGKMKSVPTLTLVGAMEFAKQCEIVNKTKLAGENN